MGHLSTERDRSPMKHIEFVHIEDEKDLVVSFALAPGGQHSLTLLRSPQYEHLLPPEDRRPTVSLSSAPDGDDYLISVLWQGPRVEVRSDKHVYLLDSSALSEEDRIEAFAVLRKMATGGVFHLQDG